MYEKLDTCPVCQFTSFKNYLITADYHLTQESFALVQCKKCEHVFTNPRPSKENISRFYESPDYISHTSKSQGLISPLYKIARDFNLRWKKTLIEHYQQVGTLLDYGAGTGHFLKFINDIQGWSAQGIEPAEKARDFAKDLGLTVHNELGPNNEQKFDVITAWHVIEHVHELRSTIKAIRKRMHDTSTFLMAVPNPQSFDAKHYGEYWAGYDVPRHLHHFTRSSVEKLLVASKLKLAKVIPMKLDAFYVSMLSEKYQKKSAPLINAIKVGLRSNANGKRNGQYSSLVYIITK